MYEHTTTELAEYLGIHRQNINVYIRNGRIKATYKTKLNSSTKYYINHNEYIKFCDWYSGNRYEKCGFAYKKTPDIDEYYLEQSKYNSYVALKIQRNKSILEAKYLSIRKIKDISLEFSLKESTIKSILGKNRETNFKKELIKMNNIFI